MTMLAFMLLLGMSAAEGTALSPVPAAAGVPVSTTTAVAASPVVRASTGSVPSAEHVAAPPSEYLTLKEKVQQDLNAVRRARYALRRAQQRADPGAAAQAEKRLQEAKESLKRHRSRMRELLVPQPPRRAPKAPEKPRG